MNVYQREKARKSNKQEGAKKDCNECLQPNTNEIIENINNQNQDSKNVFPRKNNFTLIKRRNIELNCPNNQHKNISSSYNLMTVLSTEVEELRKKNYYLKKSLTELKLNSQQIKNLSHDKNTLLFEFKQQDLKFSEKLQEREKELDLFKQKIEKQKFSKEPTFIGDFQKQNKQTFQFTDPISTSLLLSNPQRSFFSHDNLNKQNEELRDLISKQEETLCIINTQLNLFIQSKESILNKNHTIQNKDHFFRLSSIPTEKKEMEVKKHFYQKELQRLIQQRKEIMMERKIEKCR